MAKAMAGKAPWQEGYEGNPFRRFTQKQMYDAGMHHVGKGYVDQDTWDKMPKHPKMVEHTLPSGHKVKVVDGDYDAYIGHQRPDQNKTVAMLAEISDAFNLADSKRKRPISVKHVDGPREGHINWLEYNANRQMMMVEFATDQAVVVYFQVPANVWHILEHWALNGATRYDGKHMLGIQFWDFVRIRGQLRGSKYRYVYSQDGQRLTGATSPDGGPPIGGKAKATVAPKEIAGAFNRASAEAYVKSRGKKPAKTDEELKEQVAKLRKDV